MVYTVDMYKARDHFYFIHCVSKKIISLFLKLFLSFFLSINPQM